MWLASPVYEALLKQFKVAMALSLFLLRSLSLSSISPSCFASSPLTRSSTPPWLTQQHEQKARPTDSTIIYLDDVRVDESPRLPSRRRVERRPARDSRLQTSPEAAPASLACRPSDSQEARPTWREGRLGARSVDADLAWWDQLAMRLPPTACAHARARGCVNGRGMEEERGRRIRMGADEKDGGKG